MAALAVGVGAMAAFAGGLWFAYHEGTKHAAVVTTSFRASSRFGGFVPAAAAQNVPLIATPTPTRSRSSPRKRAA